MVLTLNNLKPKKGSQKKRRRVGRGNSSGSGTYSSRGMKGQRSRSGGKSGLKRLGMKMMLQNIPKNRGFKSKKEKPEIVSIGDINKHFKEGAVVSPKDLQNLGLVDNIKAGVKILGNGELKVKKIKFFNIKMTEKVKEQVEKMDGKIIMKKVEKSK